MDRSNLLSLFMNTEHTPAPWSYNETTGVVNGGFRGGRIAGVSHECNSMPTKRDRANARLIAAAPELLKALEIIRAIATPVSTLPWEKTQPVDFAKSMDEIAKQCRAVIARATGQ